MNDDSLSKYEEQYDQLKKVNKDAEKLRGCMYFWEHELVAFVSVELRSGKTWIDTLEVVKKFRGRHLSSQLLDVAVKKFGATDLRVHKDNEKAIGIFKTYGFKTYDKKGSWLYMSLREDAKAIEPTEDEKSKPIVNNLQTEEIEKHKKSANESGGNFMIYENDSMDVFLDAATESIFGKKGVEDLLKHTRKKLVKSLKTESQCDIYLQKINEESKKFNEAVSTLMSAQAKFDAGKIDKKEMKTTLKSALSLLNANCKILNIKLGDVVDDKKAISRQDIASFASYVKGLKGIVKEIKVARKKGIAIESTVGDYDENDEFFEATEASANYYANKELKAIQKTAKNEYLASQNLKEVAKNPNIDKHTRAWAAKNSHNEIMSANGHARYINPRNTRAIPSDSKGAKDHYNITRNIQNNTGEERALAKKIASSTKAKESAYDEYDDSYLYDDDDYLFESASNLVDGLFDNEYDFDFDEEDEAEESSSDDRISYGPTRNVSYGPKKYVSLPAGSRPDKFESHHKGEGPRPGNFTVTNTKGISYGPTTKVTRHSRPTGKISYVQSSKESAFDFDFFENGFSSEDDYDEAFEAGKSHDMGYDTTEIGYSMRASRNMNENPVYIKRSILFAILGSIGITSPIALGLLISWWKKSKTARTYGGYRFDEACDALKEIARLEGRRGKFLSGNTNGKIKEQERVLKEIDRDRASKGEPSIKKSFKMILADISKYPDSKEYKELMKVLPKKETVDSTLEAAFYTDDTYLFQDEFDDYEDCDYETESAYESAYDITAGLFEDPDTDYDNFF